MSGHPSRQTPSQALRFLAIGGANTVVTGGIFLVLSSLVVPALAYTVAFAIGIALAVSVTPRLVFGTRASKGQRVRYLGWYLGVYVVGLGLVGVLHDRMLLGNTQVAAITFVTTAGLSFLGARLLFAERPETAPEPNG